MTFDLIVVGAGSAGLACAHRASELGARVALIERDKVGGTCVHRGCVPKKLMWHMAHWQCEAERLDTARLISSPPSVNVRKLMPAISARTQSIQQSLKTSLDDAGVTLIYGSAHIDSAGSVHVGNQSFNAAHIALATGSKPSKPAYKGAHLVALSHDVFDLKTLPDRICIVGGGYIGTELAYILTVLGSSVTILDRGPRLLQQFEEDAASLVMERFKEIDITLKFDHCVERVSKGANGALVVESDSGWSDDFDWVLDVTGREPAHQQCDLDIDTEDAGSSTAPITAFANTDHPNVYAIGDVSGAPQLTPVARAQGQNLAEHLFAKEPSIKPIETLATAVFAEPPIAQIERLESETSQRRMDKKRFAPLIDGLFDTVPQREHLLIARSTEGRAKRLTMVGDHAADFIQALSPAVDAQLDFMQTSKMTRIHPTLGEELFALIDDLA